MIMMVNQWWCMMLVIDGWWWLINDDLQWLNIVNPWWSMTANDGWWWLIQSSCWKPVSLQQPLSMFSLNTSSALAAKHNAARTGITLVHLGQHDSMLRERLEDTRLDLPGSPKESPQNCRPNRALQPLLWRTISKTLSILPIKQKNYKNNSNIEILVFPI